MSRNESLRDYANSVCTIENELSFTRYVLPEYDKRFALLSGLREEFEIKKVIFCENQEQSFDSLV